MFKHDYIRCEKSFQFAIIIDWGCYLFGDNKYAKHLQFIVCLMLHNMCYLVYTIYIWYNISLCLWFKTCFSLVSDARIFPCRKTIYGLIILTVLNECMCNKL